MLLPFLSDENDPNHPSHRLFVMEVTKTDDDRVPQDGDNRMMESVPVRDVVCMVMYGRETSTCGVLSYVYTAPACRGRAYAKKLVGD